MTDAAVPAVLAAAVVEVVGGTDAFGLFDGFGMFDGLTADLVGFAVVAEVDDDAGRDLTPADDTRRAFAVASTVAITSDAATSKSSNPFASSSMSAPLLAAAVVAAVCVLVAASD